MSEVCVKLFGFQGVYDWKQTVPRAKNGGQQSSVFTQQRSPVCGWAVMLFDSLWCMRGTDTLSTLRHRHVAVEELWRVGLHAQLCMGGGCHGCHSVWHMHDQ